MVAKLEALILNYKKMYKESIKETKLAKTEYQEALMSGYSDGLEMSIMDLEELLKEAKLEKEFE